MRLLHAISGRIRCLQICRLCDGPCQNSDAIFHLIIFLQSLCLKSSLGESSHHQNAWSDLWLRVGAHRFANQGISRDKVYDLKDAAIAVHRKLVRVLVRKHNVVTS
jgi:hypothetical protein